MTIKRVRLQENIHEKLMYLKRKSNAKSINDVIASLITIAEEQYLQGHISTANKDILLRYDDGRLVEIKMVKK